jgi:antitoxin ParD1/3/4
MSLLDIPCSSNDDSGQEDRAMENESVHFSLPAPMRRWIDEQIQAGRYGNVSEYIRELIRRDQDRAAEARLEQLLLAGLDSGESVEVTPEFWERKKQELLARASVLMDKKRREAP